MVAPYWPSQSCFQGQLISSFIPVTHIGAWVLSLMRASSIPQGQIFTSSYFVMSWAHKRHPSVHLNLLYIIIAQFHQDHYNSNRKLSSDSFAVWHSDNFLKGAGAAPGCLGRGGKMPQCCARQSWKVHCQSWKSMLPVLKKSMLPVVKKVAWWGGGGGGGLTYLFFGLKKSCCKFYIIG